MDEAGHIHNVVYLRYLEETRIDVFSVNPPKPGAAALAFAVVAEMDIEYLRPLAYRPEPVRVETWVARIGTSSFGLSHEVHDGDTLHARAQSTMVAFDAGTSRARPLRSEERAVLEELTDDRVGRVA
jgi:acyl-CoA thioester hydrolase